MNYEKSYFRDVSHDPTPLFIQRELILSITPLRCINSLMAEKRKPTYDLDAFKATFSSIEKLAVTGTALRNAAALGFGRIEILKTIQTMQRDHFYKSMTAYTNHRQWQDVYHVPSPVGILYVKFTADAITEFLLLSFKERGND